MKNVLRHLSSFIAPVVMCLVLPYLIIWFEHRSLIPPVTPLTGLFIIGLMVSLVGLVLFMATVGRFIMIGNGTIMPWDPIVSGLVPVQSS